MLEIMKKMGEMGERWGKTQCFEVKINGLLGHPWGIGCSRMVRVSVPSGEDEMRIARRGKCERWNISATLTEGFGSGRIRGIRKHINYSDINYRARGDSGAVGLRQFFLQKKRFRLWIISKTCVLTQYMTPAVMPRIIAKTFNTTLKGTKL